MKNVFTCTGIALLALGATVAGQGRDASQLLADARQAMGGDKLAAVKTLTASGRVQRTNPRDQTVENEFEIAMELPDRYLMRSVLMAMGNMSVYRNSGFNGGQVIEEVDRPPNLAAGHMVVIRMAGPGGSSVDPENMTAAQKAEFDRTRLLANKKEFARLTLGMFASAPAAYPLELTYAGEAESPDGKAEVIDVTGEGDFAARLFIDAGTHLPLMLSWMDKEPIVIQMGGPGGLAGPGGAAIGGGGHAAIAVERGPGGAGNMSADDREKFEKELEARRKEAESRRRTVEYRIFYADYQSVGGVMLPHRIQRSVDGKTTEEMIFESFKINPTIDAKKFQASK